MTSITSKQLLTSSILLHHCF